MPLYPQIEPFDHGMLDVGEGHSVYWEMCGNPQGKPAMVLHGGPGSGCTPVWRRFFNPQAYLIVLMDQRGCGRSTPHASIPAADLTANTTWHLIDDIERLRVTLGIEHWLIFAGSWGTTLALAYALANIERVSEMVLFSITTTSRREVDWVTVDSGRFFPEAWERFQNGVPVALKNRRLVDAYAILLQDDDLSVRDKAAKDWCAWEDSHVAVNPGYKPNSRYNDLKFRMAFARLVTHYWRHSAWIEEGLLISSASKLRGIPSELIHGRLDVSTPPDVAWALARAWTGSNLTLVDNAGHGAGRDDVDELLIKATDRFSTS
jgi:proline iminopeptidase